MNKTYWANIGDIIYSSEHVFFILELISLHERQNYSEVLVLNIMNNNNINGGDNKLIYKISLNMKETESFYNLLK